MSSVSIKTVAKKAGVSLGTVSNVINRPEVVRPETRAKVEAAIAELGYVPNASARQLVAGTSNTVAYLVLDASNPFFTDVARGAQRAAEPHGLALFVCDSDQSQEREDRLLQQLTQLRVRGVLATALNYENPNLDRLRQTGVPVVLVDGAPGLADDWCAVGVDDVAGGEMAVSHLLEAGCENIAFVGGPLVVPQVADRLAGAQKALVEAGLKTESLQVLETTSPTISQGRRAAERVLGIARLERPSGIFCANDLLAFGLVQYLIQNGVQVPGDIAVVGYDDIELASAANPPLTSISQPRSALGTTGMGLLIEEVEDPGHSHRHVRFTPELIARSSTMR